MKTLVDSVTRSRSPKIDRIYLHVQVSNTAGKAFYERHGFKQAGVHEDYYKKIQPRDAWVLERSFPPADDLLTTDLTIAPKH